MTFVGPETSITNALLVDMTSGVSSLVRTVSTVMLGSWEGSRRPVRKYWQPTAGTSLALETGDQHQA